MADAFPPDEQGWQRVAVDPAVVAARVAGISYGFLLFDDTGSEWSAAGRASFASGTFPIASFTAANPERRRLPI